MKHFFQLITSLTILSGCTINVITPAESTNSSEVSAQQSTTQATELPSNLRPENTNSSGNNAISIPTGETTLNTQPTPIPTATPKSETTVNNAPASPATTATPAPSTATPSPVVSSPPINAPTLPESATLKAPTSLRTKSIEETSVTISWQPSTNADYYRVYQDGVIIGDNINQLQFTATNLSSGLNYEFQVSAVNSTGEESPKSRTLSVGFF